MAIWLSDIWKTFSCSFCKSAECWVYHVNAKKGMFLVNAGARKQWR